MNIMHWFLAQSGFDWKYLTIRVSFMIFGKEGKCRVGAEEGGHASCVWDLPQKNFEISDAQRSHFMPSELNHV